MMSKTHQLIKHTRRNGFTLIEVLFVFAIISIISMISVPFYQNYTIRTKISSDFSLIKPLMRSMNLEYALNKQWPASNEEAGAREPEYYKGEYLMSALVTDDPQPGSMILTYDADEIPVLRGTDTLVFYPRVGGGQGGDWACDQGSIPAKYRPPNCR